MAAKTEKMRFWIVAHSKWSYVGIVPKIIFEKLTQKLIDFEAFLVGKVPKSIVFNRDCLEIEKFKIEKIMKIKKGSNKKIVFSRPLEKYVLGK